MSTKTNLILDLGMLGAMLAVTNPHLTGNTIHEWLGISLTAALITHLLLHWDWIVNVGKEFFRKFLHQSRLNFVVDTLFFIAMTGSIFSGILISKDVLATLGIQLDVNRNWKMIHTLTSDASLIALGIHFALHWKWIVNSMGRYVVNPIHNVFRRRPASQPLASRSLQAGKN